ncbi:site-specific integrase [Nicoliella lavandulae]|uniref:Site-specific integrase n=1 Tax=Nicoliella lavandulae TaxID=3082954 RepID=A0ABU8SM62_9LACO
MAKIKKYTTKDGQKHYMFRIYLGVDERTGKKRQTTRRGFKTQKEAKLAISKMELQIEADELEQHSKTKFKQVYAEFVESYRPSVRESTFYNFRTMSINHILPKFGEMYIEKIKPVDIQRQLNQWAKEFQSFGMVLQIFKRICTFALRRGYIKHNPASMVIMPKAKDKDKTKNFYTRDELKQFFNAPYFRLHTRFRIYVYFRLLAFTGLRKSEGLVLTWSNIDFDKHTLTVSKTLSKSVNGGNVISKPKTKESERTILIDDKTLNVLKQWQIEQRKQLLLQGINITNLDAYVFSKDGKHHFALSLPKQWLSTIYHTTDMPQISVHGFRHTHASMLFAASVPIKEVQVRLGHSDPRMTMDVYTHVSPEIHKEAVDKLSNYANF